MTKATQAAAAVTTTAPIEYKPQSLHLVGPAMTVMSQAVVHIRQGYTLNTDAPLELFGGTGNMSIVLKLGDPELQFVQAAKTATDEAMQRQQAQMERDIEAAAAQLVADRERAAARAVMQAQIAAQEATLAALKAAAAA